MVLKKPLFTPAEGAEIAAILKAENLPIHIVAVVLNVSRLTLAEWRRQQIGPPFRLLKRGVVVYPREGFERYLRAYGRAATDAGGGRRLRTRISGPFSPADMPELSKVRPSVSERGAAGA